MGKNDANGFYRFAQDYYNLVQTKVRTGIWTQKDSMLKVCGKNPPHKNKQIHNIVAGILGKAISKEKFQEFESTLWVKKFGNKKLSSYCKNIEELRKSHGNLFKQYIEDLQKKDKVKLTKEEKSELTLISDDTLNDWVQKIADFFEIEPQYSQRFANLFSMAQLYTAIDTPRSGFNSTCKWCGAENQYRSQTTIEINSETGEVFTNANCQRLPADTQRPFSGKIERYIDKLGYELAKIKAKELANIDSHKIIVQIILEQNAFEYEESIRSAKIKNANAKAKKSLEEALKKYTKSLDYKDERIKKFSDSICPYCGESLGDDEEIDHILPRSYTLKNYGTVFNSEGNLIYVHQKCNQAKKEKLYKFSDIKISVSEKWIDEQISTIKNYKTFSILNQEQQQAFRYALFLENSNPNFIKVANWLRTDQGSRVNGTQKYLAKKIQTKLQELLPNKNLEFEFILADANDVSELRKKYAKENPLLAKPEKQPTSSHTIDAIMAFISQYPKVMKQDILPSADEILNFVSINNIYTKPISKIQKDKIGNLGGTTIFKDTIYQECFAPIYEFDGKYLAGFATAGHKPSFENCTEIKARDFNAISVYFKPKKEKPNGLTVYELDKPRILQLFHNVSQNVSNEIKLAQLLYKFCYTQLKTTILEAPNVLKDDKKLSTKIYDKTILLPIKQEWINFDKAFRAYLQDSSIEYKEKDGKYAIADDIIVAFCARYFNITNKTIRNKARKVFSLPTIEAPSGGFRIRRFNHKNEPLFQLVGIDGAKSAGFGIKNGKINTAVDVTLATLAKSKNISFKEPEKIELQDYIDMSAWRDITNIVNIDSVKIFVAPASTNRPLVRVVLPMDIFKNMLNTKSFNYLEISDIKLTNNDSFGISKQKFDEFFKNINFIPRDDKFKIICANLQSIELEFSNNNKTVMKYYDNGVDVNLK